MKAGYNEPDNMRCFDHDPRSPYYDDGGKDTWIESRGCDISDELEKFLESDKKYLIDNAREFIEAMYNSDDTKIQNAFEAVLEVMAEREWENQSEY